MTKAKVEQFLGHTPEYLDRARRGETVMIVDGEHEVAQLVPSKPDESASQERPLTLEALVARGVVRRPKGKLPDDFFTRPRPKLPGGLLQALLDERRESW